MTRVSIHEDDPGYWQYCVARAHGKTIHVFLDGVEQKECVTADDERRIVKRAALYPDGTPKLDAALDKIAYETVIGDVRIEFRDEGK